MVLRDSSAVCPQTTDRAKFYLKIWKVETTTMNCDFGLSRCSTIDLIHHSAVSLLGYQLSPGDRVSLLLYKIKSLEFS